MNSSNHLGLTMYSNSAPNPYGFIYHPINAVLTDYGSKQAPISGNVPISYVKFDSHQELAWSSNIFGHSTSYFSEALTKYTSFSLGNNEPVMQISPIERGILFLLKDELKLRLRRGVPILSHNSFSTRDLSCMVVCSDKTDLVFLGGAENTLVGFNLEKEKEIVKYFLDPDESGCSLMRSQHKFICCADNTGKVTIRDIDKFKTVYKFDTHTGQLLDFDIQGNYLITCGTSSTRQLPDKCLRLYDLRTGKYVRPIVTFLPFNMVRFSPAFSTKLVAACDTGYYQMIDTTDTVHMVSSEFSRQIQLPPEANLTCMDVSRNGQAVLFGDSLGVMHLYGTNPNITFNPYSAVTEFADPVEPTPPIPPHDNITPLSTVPNLYTNNSQEDLSSNALKSYDSMSRHETKAIDELILQSMINRSDVGYATNPYRGYGVTGYVRGAVKLIKTDIARSSS